MIRETSTVFGIDDASGLEYNIVREGGMHGVVYVSLGLGNPTGVKGMHTRHGSKEVMVRGGELVGFHPCSECIGGSRSLIGERTVEVSLDDDKPVGQASFTDKLLGVVIEKVLG